MADALRIRRPQESGGPLPLILTAALVVLPLIAVRILLRRGIPLHHENPALNLLLNALPILLPLLLSVWFFREGPDYYADDERVIGHTHFRSSFRHAWWMMGLLLAPPLALLAVTAYEAAGWASRGALPDWSTPAGSALGTYVFTAAFLLVYGTLVRESAAVRVGNAGMRAGNLHFYEWANVHHFARRGDVYSLYHRAQPRLPAAQFALPDPAGRDALEAHLLANGIPVEAAEHPFLRTVKAAVLVGTAALAAGGIALYAVAGLDLRWSLLLCAAAGVAATMLLEKVRAAAAITKQKPVWDPL